MTLVSPSQSNPGDEITVNSINGPVNQLASVINGQIDDTNISNVSGSKISTGTLSYAKTDGKIGWEEIGRATLSTAGDALTISSLPPRKYLRVWVYLLAAGSIAGIVRFNNDTTTTYAARFSTDFGTGGTAVSSNGVGFADAGVTSAPIFTRMDIINISGQEKIIQSNVVSQGAAGSANAPSVRIIYGKWANTSSQITRIDVANSSTGDYAIGSEIVVWGKD